MDTSSVVMCTYPYDSRIFMILCAVILLSLAARLTTVSLDISLMFLVYAISIDRCNKIFDLGT